MKANSFRSQAGRRSEVGQALLFTLLGLGLFLIGAMAFAIDLSYMWLNRQSAQTAADAACTAGVMDLLVYATNGTLTNGSGGTLTFPTISGGNAQAVDCNTTNPNTSATNPSPCVYAALNGFSSTAQHISGCSGAGCAQGSGNNVYVDFPNPSNYPNITLASTTLAPTNLMRVSVSDNIPTFFAALLRGLTRQSTGATALCGILSTNAPIPILVLDPRSDAGTLHMNGGGSVSSPTCGTEPCGDIVILGGGARSIQVNSSNSSAVSAGNNPTINLCGGGTNYCGSTMGVWGSESAATGFWDTSSICSTVNKTGSTSNCQGTQTLPQWNSPSAPIADPFAGISAPSVPNFATASNPQPTIVCPSGMALATCQASSNPNGNCPTGFTCVLYPGNGCPDPLGCYEYQPGSYTSGICVGNSCSLSKYGTAIFDPGIYYMAGQCKNGETGSLCEESGSCVRPSTANGDGSGGTAFYFSDAYGLSVAANGGGCGGVSAFSALSGSGSIPLGVKCTSSSTVPPNITSTTTLSGSVLLAPCTGPESTTGLCAPNCAINNSHGYGDPEGIADQYGEQRGILFFQDRALAANASSWSGGGSMLLAGTMYFHQCKTSGSDTGQGCQDSTAFNDVLSLGGSSGSSTYVLGDIIVDKLTVGGSGQIVMDLNPSAAFTTLKAALLQ